MWSDFNFFIFLFFLFFLVFYFFFKQLYVLNNYVLLNNFYFLFFIFYIFIYVYFFLLNNLFLNMNFNYFNNFFYFKNTINFFYFPYIYIFLLITFLSVILSFIYNSNELLTFIFYILIILISGYFIFFTKSIILFFFFYELLLIPSFLILYKFAKTRKAIEAAFLMFFWTQFGAIFLIFSFLYLFLITNTSNFFFFNNYSFTQFDTNFLLILWIIGFGVKIPIWPFYNWLPKAHVEASTNFSIFLSGVLVKFAFFGFFKCLFIIQLESTFYWTIPFLLIGIIDSVVKLFYQIDLKKLIAYSTVVEMHWLFLSLITGQTFLYLATFAMLISHAIISTNSFLLVDSINRRFKTRLITEVKGINFLLPKLFLMILINLIIFLGFPGSIFFLAEFLFFSFLLDYFPLLFFILIFLLYLLLPIFFFKNWFTVIFSYSNFLNKKLFIDLEKIELIIYLFNFFLLFWLGVTYLYLI